MRKRLLFERLFKGVKNHMAELLSRMSIDRLDSIRRHRTAPTYKYGDMLAKMVVTGSDP